MYQNFWLVSLVIIIVWGTIPILLKQLVKTHAPYPIMLLSAIMFGIVGVILSICHVPSQMQKVIQRLSASDWLSLAFIVVGGSLFANLLYMWALQRFNSPILVTVTSTFPLVTVLLGIWLLKERLSMIAGLGILLIVGGVMCLAYSNGGHHV